MACDQPIRICLLTGNFHPVIGGGEKHALALAREMTQQGAQVMVLTRWRNRALPAREKVMGIPVVRVGPPGFPRLGKYLMLPAVLRQLRRERANYDIIYVCGLRVLGLPGVVAAGRLGKKCVLRAEALGELSGDFIWRRNPGAPVRPLLQRLFQPFIRRRNRRLLAGAAAFVSISAPVRAEYLACGVPPDRIHDITNGIDPEEFSPADPARRLALRAQLGLPADRVICAYSGKLNRGKGLQFLVEVWRRLAAERQDLLLLLVGGGGGQAIACEAELRGLIREHGLADKITITGYTQKVPDYLRAADYFLFPSESETLSLALLEALACELPAVASRIPGITDFLRDGVNGRLAAPNDMAQWRNAIAAMLDDPAAARALGRAGRQTVLQEFGIARDAARHLDLFRQFCPPRHAGQNSACPAPAICL